VSALQSANNLAQSQKSGKADDKKKNVEYAAAAWKQIVARYQVCTAASFSTFLTLSSHGKSLAYPMSFVSVYVMLGVLWLNA